MIRPCSAYRAPTKDDGRCFNGFPQRSGICWGGNPGMSITPHCQREEWCGRVFNDSGGRPTNLPDALLSTGVGNHFADVSKMVGILSSTKEQSDG